MKTVTVHGRSIRHRNNAGLNIPVCAANAKLLNLDSGRWAMGAPSQVTCKRCLRIMYPQDFPSRKRVSRDVGGFV